MLLLLLFLVGNVFVVRICAVSSVSPRECNCPEPEIADFCFTIQENSPVGSVVGTVNGSTGQYQWSTNEVFMATSQLFSISSSGLITTAAILDREGTDYDQRLSRKFSLENNNYCFRLGVGTSPGSEVVDIQITDVNDNPPMFTQNNYTIMVPESMGNSRTPSCIRDGQNLFGSLIAVDRDNSNTGVIYEVENGSPFIIPNNSFPCIQGVGLDRDVPPSTYSVILIALDSDNPALNSTTNVTFELMDINDNAPELVNPPPIIPINETLMPGEIVYQFEAHDRDAGNNGEAGLLYALVEPESSSYFRIDAANGSLILTQPVDAEMFTTSFELMVIAKDNEGGDGSLFSPPSEVTIVVRDINEYGTLTGFFEENDIVVVEGTYYNGTIANGRLIDTDKNSSNRMTDVFNLTDFSDSVVVNITHVTFPSDSPPTRTFFRLQMFGTPDREKEPVITAVITLVEGGIPVLYVTRTINITIEDINDNGPYLNTSNFTITEEQVSEIDLSLYTLDIDNGSNATVASFELVSANAGGSILMNKFTISTNGLLTVQPLDRDTVGNIITVVVNITDGGNPPMWNLSTFTLTVADINDNPPSFIPLSYTLNVTENSHVGTLIGQIHAEDPDEDSGPVTYAILPPSDDFSVDAKTGKLHTKRVFDREDDLAMIKLTIVAKDGLDPNKNASMDYVVMINDENDNNPIFQSEFEFSAPVSLKVGNSVGEVEAIDKDSSPENTVIVFKILNSDFFAIPNNASGDIVLKSLLNGTGVYFFNVSAFNPGREENRSTVKVKINVTQGNLLSTTLIIVIATTGAFFSVLIFIVILLLAFVVWKNQKSKRQLQLQSEADGLNNLQTILKIPAAAPVTNGTAGAKSSRVTFKERVEETHYDEEISVINSTTSTIKKESVTKFDGSPQVRHEEACEALSPTSLSPISLSSSPSNGKPGQLNGGVGGVTVVDLEMSPRQVINGDINGRYQCDMLSRSPPMLRMPSGNPGASRGRTAAEMMEYSQGTSSDGGHTSVHDMDDESMFSDDASIVNTALSRFGSARPDMSSYDPASSHPHMELHRHLPPMSHGQHTNSSSLAKLHAYNLAQLAKSNDSDTRPAQYSPMLSPDQDLTPTDNTIHHSNTISTESSIRTPSAGMNHMGMAANSKHLHMNGSRNYTHPPLVMPDAFPRDPPEVHRFPMGSFVDYGEASTYASTELDEALGFNETEPGIISLTATDYDDDTQL